MKVHGKDPSEIDVVVVGSAGSLLEQDLGPAIDDIEYIMRVNQGNKYINDYKDKVGSRTDGSFNKMSGKRFVQSFPEPNEKYVFTEDLRLPLIEPRHDYDRFIMCDYKDRLPFNNYPVIQFGENAYGVSRSFYKQGRGQLARRSPSTGFVCVLMAMRLFKSVTICGFDGFHTAHFYKRRKKDIGDRHPGEMEMERYFQLEEAGRIKILGKIKGSWEGAIRPGAANSSNNLHEKKKKS